MKYVENIKVFNRLEVPITLTTKQHTDFNDVAVHMMYRQRLSFQRTHHMLTYAGNLTEKHNINFLNPNYTEFIHFMDHMEHIEKTTPAMLKYIWQIMQKFLTSFGIPYGPGTQWNYTPPSIPPSRPRQIPTPTKLHKMIHYRYSKDPAKNSFLQYTILHSSIIGWRNPSELCLLTIDDIDIENHSIIITEKKKHHKKRLLILDYPQIISDRHVKSIQNWIDIWRPRITTQHSQNYLYISPTNGKPLRQMQYTKYINYNVNPVFPDFHLYDTRHFCATGMLIKEKLNTGYWNKYKIKRHLGHERDHTTDIYIQYAEQYMKIAPYDWFNYLLGNRKSFYRRKPSEPQKTGHLNSFSSYRSEISEQKQTTRQEKKQSSEPRKTRHLKNKSINSLHLFLNQNNKFNNIMGVAG